MKVAIYARVSTTNHGQDPAVQLRELREYCTRRGGNVSSMSIQACQVARNGVRHSIGSGQTAGGVSFPPWSSTDTIVLRDRSANWSTRSKSSARSESISSRCTRVWTLQRQTAGLSSGSSRASRNSSGS